MPDRPHIPDGSGGVHLNVEGDGFSGVALTWMSIVALVVGLLAGGFIVWKLFKFEPSAEYEASAEALVVSLEAKEDSLRTARSAIDEADETVEAANEIASAAMHQLNVARDEVAHARREAEAAVARALGLREPVERMLAEAEVVRKETQVERAIRNECAMCVRAVQEQEAVIGALQGAVRERDVRLGLMSRTNQALNAGLALAQAEVDRAAGSLVPKWYDGFGLTVGVGCTFGQDGDCGPAAIVGYSLSTRRLVSWFR